LPSVLAKAVPPVNLCYNFSPPKKVVLTFKI